MLSAAAAFRCNCSEALCSRVLFNRSCVCSGCSPISSGGLTLAGKSAAAHSCLWQHGVRNACRVVSKCGCGGVHEVSIRVCTVATSQIMMRRVRQWFEGVVASFYQEKVWWPCSS